MEEKQSKCVGRVHKFPNVGFTFSSKALEAMVTYFITPGITSEIKLKALSRDSLD
jgi:hypothetical protein